MFQFKFRHSVVAGAAIALSALGLSAALLGVETRPAVANEPFPVNDQDDIYGGRDFDPIDLIHEANLNRGQTPQEFREQTRDNIDSASRDFRQMQLERIRQMQQQNVEAAETVESEE